MSIMQEGFLSPDINNFVLKSRAVHAPILELLKEINIDAQKLLLELKFSPDDSRQKHICTLLFVRLLSNYQGAILLAESGMIVETGTLVRSCLESTIFMCAIMNNENLIEELITDNFQGRKTRAAWLNKKIEDGVLSDSPLGNQLRKFIKDLPTDLPKAKLKVKDVADIGKVDNLYIFYKIFSDDAAHPTIQSLNRYFVDDEGNQADLVRWGPACSPKEIAYTLSLLGFFILTACQAHADFHNNKDLPIKLKSYLKRLMGL